MYHLKPCLAVSVVDPIKFYCYHFRRFVNAQLFTTEQNYYLKTVDLVP